VHVDGYVSSTIIQERAVKFNLSPGAAQALEACVLDALGFKQLLLSAIDHPHAGILIQGLLAPAAMFVVESYDCLTKLIPDSKNTLSCDTADFLRSARHRAKLLNNPQKSIQDVSLELVCIAQQQRRDSLAPHHGLLGPLKRILQPDMGLYLYDGNIIWTTHATVFCFGDTGDPLKIAFKFGQAVGEYLTTVLELFDTREVTLSGKHSLPGRFEMRDIKYEQIYRRGSLGSGRFEVGAALVLFLASANFSYHIIGGFLPDLGHTQLRLKLITAYHIASGLQMIQDGLVRPDTPRSKMKEIFAELVGNRNGRWLRKNQRLRNLLLHYLPNPNIINKVSSGDTRTIVVERLAGMSLEQLNQLVDRYLLAVTTGLQQGFQLEGDPFWLGRVK
jgi:hypothetical protein